ncbi:outer membrane protein assembly factor BamB family protein [Paenibacillus dakarensis]|uniref:outer membrane protein assembly factor BamB family protein n=1 Tax=Paenibacillus dakarensis TaxID=1527293 RepID=UPI0006D5546D|nr:PQQ-binding-like beta-propeller repeat protein [Paenibacillus dakarensis]
MLKILKKRSNRYLLKRIAAGVVAGLLVTSTLPIQVNAETADVSVNSINSYPTIKVPELKPTWTLKVDNKLDSYGSYYSNYSAIAEDGKVFTFVDKKLIALNAKSGKKLWSYGKNLTPYVVYNNGIIYGLTGDQKPYALNSKTGKVKWQSSSSTFIDKQQRIERLVPTSDALYVIKGSVTYAFDKITGKLRWKTDEPMADGSGTDYLEESNGVILRTFLVQGALTSTQLDAFDKKTGKKLWGVFGQGEAIRIKDGLVYSVDYHSHRMSDYQSLPERKHIVNIYNLKTGVKKGTREYSWTLTGEPPYPYDYRNIFISGGKLYIEQADQVAEYDFDTYKSNQAPIRTFKMPYGDDWSLLKIVQDRLIFQNIKTGELTGVKMVNNRQIGWYGDAPFSQIDVYGKGVYRAQRNGTYLGINFLTTQPVFRVTTGSDLHGTTLKTGEMIIIQAEGKLIGVKLPASLK